MLAFVCGTLDKLTLCFMQKGLRFLTSKMRILMAVATFQAVSRFGNEVLRVLHTGVYMILTLLI